MKTAVRKVSPSLVAPAELTADPDRRATVGPRLAGHASRVHVNTGQQVKVGDPLVELTSLEVGVAQAALLSAWAGLRVAKQAEQRARRLAARQIVSASDLEEIRSVSKCGLSAVTIVFEEGTDIYRARQLVAERLTEARESIPEGYGSPEMGPIATVLGEIFQFEVRGEPRCAPGSDTPECYSPMELRTLLGWFVAYQLKSVPGVVEINTFGGELKTFEVEPDPDTRPMGLDASRP